MITVDNKGGRNGTIGPDYFQLDLRAGWRRPVRGGGGFPRPAQLGIRYTF